MRTVIAIILHPSRVLFESICQSYDNFNVNAETNPQTETAFLVRMSINGRKRPSAIAHCNRRARPFPLYNTQGSAAPYRHCFGLFRTELKNRHFTIPTSNNLPGCSRPMRLPLRVFEGQCGYPCRWSNGSLADRPNEMPTTEREALHSNMPCG